MTTENALDLDLGWGITEEAFAAIIDDMKQPPAPPRVMIEFGSGTSSVRWAQVLPETQVIAIEHDAEWCEKVRAMQVQFGVPLQVYHRPLRWQWYAGAFYQSYAKGIFPSAIDVAIIDGPPSRTYRGREACLHQIVRCLTSGARVYLDDYQRPAEQQIVRNWMHSYPDVFDLREIQVGHRIAVLVMKKRVEYPRFSMSVFRDVNAHCGKRILKQIVRRRHQCPYLKSSATGESIL